MSLSSFPQLYIELKGQKIVALIFNSGKIVVTGAKTRRT